MAQIFVLRSFRPSTRFLQGCTFVWGILAALFIGLAQAKAAYRGSPVSQKRVVADVCVYGGTSGGVIAAVQCTRMGKTAILLEPGKHLGGMTSGGLSWTDIGSRDRVWIVGGLAKEFYTRAGTHYGQNPAKVFETPPGGSGVDFAKPPSLSFEPKVAEKVFRDWIQESKAPVYYRSRLKSVRMENGAIREIETEGGLVVRAKVFIDATYEGDLLAMAGVSYTVGREANSLYGETVNGIQGPATHARAGFFEQRIDPYHVRGDAKSRLIPYLLQDEALGEIGSADKRVQSYNYRVCLTDVATNRIALTPPKNYNPANFELLARWIEARTAAGQKLTLRDFLKYDPLQNGKYDFNNRWAISTDFIGGAHEYPEGDWKKRREIAQAHEDYLRGFFHFLGNDPRVPVAVRKEMGRFGLSRDEFTDTEGWSHQLYVREARRMVSDFVMTEHHVVSEKPVPQPIGLGSYGIDMHAVRRIVQNGQPVNEGTRARPVPAPYGISYGAIVPKRNECSNLLVPFALSASHVAFGSIRMEPVFMILSQSAATAACLAIEKKAAIQDVDYAALAKQLKADGQVLGSAPTRSN